MVTSVLRVNDHYTHSNHNTGMNRLSLIIQIGITIIFKATDLIIYLATMMQRIYIDVMLLFVSDAVSALHAGN